MDMEGVRMFALTVCEKRDLKAGILSTFDDCNNGPNKFLSAIAPQFTLLCRTFSAAGRFCPAASKLRTRKEEDAE
jgi:hypothetical protein